MKNRLKLLPILIIMVIVLQLLFPVVSSATEEGTLNVTLKRDEIETNKVNITATDTQYNIVDLKYVHKRIEKENIDYFEEDNDDVYTLMISPAQSVEASFYLDGYGTYTVYAKNSHGDRYLSRITIHDPGEAPDLTLTKIEDEPLSFTIQAISETSQISILKIAKIDNINQEIDFDTEGEDIEFTKSNNVNLIYTVDEEGLYAVYAKDENGASMTSQIYLSESDNDTPIEASVTNLGNREVNIKITDSICNITTIKYAKSSEISDFDDFETKGENIDFTEGNTVDINYTLPEDGIYTFFIEDEAGYRKMIDIRVSDDKDIMAVSITQDENNPKDLTIKATDKLSNIVEMKVAIGENININYFENNGESLDITPGKEVTANYTVEENCVLNVYIKDEEGYSYLSRKTIIVSFEPAPNEPPQIELTQNQEKPKQVDVIVTDPDSFIDTIKWAKGSHDAEYFKGNGTQIGQGELGKIITTEFTIDSIGIYSVYAEDENGATTVEEINILSLEEVETPDTTAPVISGVANNTIYNDVINPTATDENLASVTLTRDGTVVNNYQNGSYIEDEGNYILTANDESGNETSISFMIDYTVPNIEINKESTDKQNVVVTINLTDNLSGIDILKIANGEQNQNYFENGGQQINLIKDGTSAVGRINVTENGIYTVYTKDLARNPKVQTFEVTEIDKTDPEPDPEPDTTAPTINLEKEVAEDNSSVELTINVIDTESEIGKVKMASGERDISYFEENGTELQMGKEDKTSTSIVNITKNGTYTIYAEDEAGNKAIKVVEITEIEEQDPEPNPEPDTTPPSITGVEDGRTYRNYVTPRISDENLEKVTLNRNGDIVEDYKNGDQIRENGNYVLTAIDKAGNRTQVSFTIDIEDEDNNETNNTNTNSNTNNSGSNTNTGNNNTNTNNSTNTSGNNTNNNETANNTNTGNTNTSGNNENNNQSITNRPSGNGNSSSSGSSTSGSVQNSSSSTASSKLPYAGTRNIIIIVIIVFIGIAAFCYIKYRKMPL